MANFGATPYNHQGLRIVQDPFWPLRIVSYGSMTGFVARWVPNQQFQVEQSVDIWRFHKIMVASNYPKFDLFCIETYGGLWFWGPPIVRTPNIWSNLGRQTSFMFFRALVWDFQWPPMTYKNLELEHVDHTILSLNCAMPCSFAREYNISKAREF